MSIILVYPSLQWKIVLGVPGAIVLEHADDISIFGGCFRALYIHDSLDFLGARFDSFHCDEASKIRNLSLI